MHRASPNIAPPDSSLIKALLAPAAFDHAADDIELVETHISWVILAGEFAYKIKKPLVLDFLDFGSLENREHCCREEIRLNKPWAPDIYIGVVPITGNRDQPRVGGDGEVLEYAVKMRRFDQALRLDAQLEAGLLTAGDMKELGRNIANRHAAAERPDPGERERLVGLARQFVLENFAPLEDIIDAETLLFLSDWTGQELDKLGTTLWRRFDDGFVRDCHGDLHLGNLVRLPDGITTFDCIEFNRDLRFTDVFADVGFLTMDLIEKGHHELSAHFLNRYLECSGDYGGIVLLDFYFVYRCLVRAKVAAIRSRERESASNRDADIREARDYCALARRQATKGPRALIIMSGLSGSGKTWLAERLMAALPAIRLRSDIERKRLFGLAESERSDSAIAAGIYTAEASAATYEHLFDLAGPILEAGHHVILDAAFLQMEQRNAARASALDAGCSPVLVRADAPAKVLRDRIRKRAALKTTVSEADLEVLEHQLATEQPPTADEHAIVVDNSGAVDVEQLASLIRKAAG